jgi:hypothetical protein
VGLHNYNASVALMSNGYCFLKSNHSLIEVKLRSSVANRTSAGPL